MFFLLFELIFWCEATNLGLCCPLNQPFSLTIEDAAGMKGHIIRTPYL